MMREDRKAATAAYKERKAPVGIYAVSCFPTGQRWVGRALDLSTIQNRLWFTLNQGSYPQPSLQAAWNAQGPASFTFEAVERLDDNALSYGRDRVLKDRLAHWSAVLNAQAI
jgi:hypothetical protein